MKVHLQRGKCLKGQCVGIKAMESSIISQPVKSLLIVFLQEFMEFIMKNDRRVA